MDGSLWVEVAAATTTSFTAASLWTNANTGTEVTKINSAADYEQISATNGYGTLN